MRGVAAGRLVQGDALQDRFSRNDEQLYHGLHLSDAESDWVKHYLRVADQVLFGRQLPPRVVVVEDVWQTPSHPPSLAPKKKTAA